MLQVLLTIRHFPNFTHRSHLSGQGVSNKWQERKEVPTFPRSSAAGEIKLLALLPTFVLGFAGVPLQAPETPASLDIGSKCRAKV